MTNVEAIELPKGAIVRHQKSGKLYVVAEVVTQPILLTRGGPQFHGNPFAETVLSVIGQRNGRNFGPIRCIGAGKCAVESGAR